MKTIVCHPCLGTGADCVDNNRKRARGHQHTCYHCKGTGVVLFDTLLPISRVGRLPDSLDVAAIAAKCRNRMRGGWAIPDAYAEIVKSVEPAPSAAQVVAKLGGIKC